MVSSRSAATGLKHIDDPTLAGIRSRRREGTLSGNEGFIYVISNSAWTRYLKIGHAVDYEDRLNKFQTSDPFRRYKLEFCWYFRDRIAAEKDVHRLLLPWWQCGEWFLMEKDEAISAIKRVNR